jgi:hypothetical protein
MLVFIDIQASVEVEYLNLTFQCSNGEIYHGDFTSEKGDTPESTRLLKIGGRIPMFELRTSMSSAMAVKTAMEGQKVGSHYRVTGTVM